VAENWIQSMNRCVGPASWDQPPRPPCTVCGKAFADHGSFPTCASHPYTPDEHCQHVIGAKCVGAECQSGCVRAKRRDTFDAKVRTHGYVDRVTGERIHDPDRLGGSAIDGVQGLQQSLDEANRREVEKMGRQIDGALGVDSSPASSEPGTRGPECALVCQEHKAGREACKLGACVRTAGVQPSDGGQKK
jgi:hypothetical protein